MTKKLIITILISIFVSYLSIQSIFPSLNGTTSFDANNAFSHIEVIAKKPHPIGSIENTKVREYIVSTLEQMGLDPSIHESNIYGNKKVYNIIAKIEGSNSSGGICVSAHYDSVPQAPGASDDATGVSVILEGIRQLLNNPKPKNDIIIVITDGEEIGLEGMYAFSKEHPYAEEVTFIINLEAKGTSGPALMFETTPGDYNTVRAFKKASDRIVSSSLMSSLYNIMPNYTDFTIFKDKNIQGMNFAFIGKGYNYHSANDNIQNVNLSTLKHMGDNFTSSLLYFSNFSLSDLKSSHNGIYFNILNIYFVLYKDILAIPFAIIALIIYAICIFIGIKKSYITIISFAKSFLAQISIIVIVFFSITAIQKCLKIVNLELYMKLSTHFYNSVLLFFGMLFLILALYYVFNKLSMKLHCTYGFIYSNTFIWLSLCLITSFILKGASYLFVFISILESLFLLIRLLKDKEEGYYLYEVTSFLISIILFLPILYLITEAFSLSNFNLISILVVLIYNLLFSKLPQKYQFKKTYLVILASLPIILSIIEITTSNVKFN